MIVTQTWTHSLPMMQQTVLLAAIRGPDGMPKYTAVKMLLRWYRRCLLLSAIDGKVIDNPYDDMGGSFTGPSIGFDAEWEHGMDQIVTEYLREIDSVPHHFHMHLMHAVEIMGYKHSVRRIREWWYALYLRLVNDLHLHPESEVELDSRLGDSRSGWLARADKATIQ